MRKSIGIPAIQPSLLATITPRPRCTAEDVSAYTERHPHPSSVGSTWVEKVEFISGRVLRSRFNWANAYEDQRLLCLVSWCGQFKMASRTAKDVMGNHAWQVFDSLNGNLLLDVVDH